MIRTGGKATGGKSAHIYMYTINNMKKPMILPTIKTEVGIDLFTCDALVALSPARVPDLSRDGGGVW